MNARQVTVLPWDTSALSGVYDAEAVSLGFETRSRWLLENHSPRARLKVAFGFEDRRGLDYEHNRAFLDKAGFLIREVSDEGFSGPSAEFIRDAPRRGGVTRILVDVSSMTRRRVAMLLSRMLLDPDPARVWAADFVYAPAAFSPPSKEETPITHCAPVIPEFAGWSDSPEQYVTALFGLGYEEGFAVGAMEQIEPAQSWALTPGGVDQRYDKACRQANRFFLDQLPAAHISTYEVLDAIGTFLTLEGLVYSCAPQSRVVIVPLGPKLFALSAMLVAAVHYPRVAVWRVSTDQLAPASNRFAVGPILGLRVIFSPSTDPAKHHKLLARIQSGG